VERPVSQNFAGGSSRKNRTAQFGANETRMPGLLLLRLMISGNRDGGSGGRRREGNSSAVPVTKEVLDWYFNK